MSNKEIVNLLWTSGWDSTYRLMDLITKGKAVQPFYINFEQRRSSEIELKRMDEISEYLFAKNPSLREFLLPLTIVNSSSIVEVEEIKNNHKALTANEYLGNQYVLLASFAENNRLDNLELSIHVDDKAYKFIKSDIELVETEDDSFYKITETSISTGAQLFRNFHFPLLNLSKTEMEKRAKQRGFDDVMEMTWFCHTPKKNGEPCGVCNPCVYTKQEGLGRRVPKPAIHKSFIRGCKRFVKKFVLKKPIA